MVSRQPGSERSGGVKAAARRANRAGLVRNREIEPAPVGQVQRQFGRLLMERGEVDGLDRRDAPLDVEMHRHRLVLGCLKLLIHGQVVAHPPDARHAAEDVADVGRLLD